MKFKKRFLMVFCSVALLAGMLGGGTVSATDDSVQYDSTSLSRLYNEVANSPDPDKSFSQLSPTAQKALIDSVTNLRFETTIIEGNSGWLLDAGGSNDLTIKLEGYSTGGELIIEYFQRIMWYYDGDFITDVPVHQSWGIGHWPWAYDGVIGESESGGRWYSYFHRFSQGKFRFNIWILPDQVITPWVDQWAFADGSYSFTHGA